MQEFKEVTYTDEEVILHEENNLFVDLDKEKTNRREQQCHILTCTFMIVGVVLIVIGFFLFSGIFVNNLLLAYPWLYDKLLIASLVTCVTGVVLYCIFWVLMCKFTKNFK